MKLKYDFTFVKVGDETMGVAMGEGAEAFKSILECNETAEAILNLLKTDVTEAQITARLREIYDAPAGVIEEKVSEMIALLREKDLLV